jgi:hypothetical protein
MKKLPIILIMLIALGVGCENKEAAKTVVLEEAFSDELLRDIIKTTWKEISNRQKEGSPISASFTDHDIYQLLHKCESELLLRKGYNYCPQCYLGHTGELCDYHKEPNETNRTYFDTNGVSKSIEVKQGDHVDFMTSGSWIGCLIFEYSTDEITWVKIDVGQYGSFLSSENMNVQFSATAIENKYGEGMALGFYRWNMIAMLKGRCDYSWNKRITSVVEPNEPNNIEGKQEVEGEDLVIMIIDERERQNNAVFEEAFSEMVIDERKEGFGTLSLNLEGKQE